LVKVAPREVMRFEEISIAAGQSARDQANAVLANARKGQHYKEGYLQALQSRLLQEARHDTLHGRASLEKQELAFAIGDVRQSQLLSEARETVAQGLSGKRVNDAYLKSLQQRLLSADHTNALLGRENTEGFELTLAIGDIRHSNLLKEARNAVAQGRSGKRVSDTYIRSLQQRLLSADRSNALLGREGAEGFELSLALGDILSLQWVKEAKDVLDRARRGQHFSESYLIALQRRLLMAERQNQELGREGKGEEALALALGELRR
jgi:hypothetical protein